MTIIPSTVAHLPEDTPVEDILALMETGHDAYLVVVIAEATRRGCPPAVRQALQRPPWCDNWILALMEAEGNSLVRAMRVRYEKGPDDENIQRQDKARRALRRRIIELQTLRRQARPRPEPIRDPAERVARRAQAALARQHATEYRHLLGAALAHHPGILTADDAPPWGEEYAAWALSAGYPLAEEWAITPRVSGYLTGASDLEYAVSRDTSGRQAVPELRHPLILHAWGGEIRRQAAHTAERLGIEARPDLRVADQDLAVVDDDPDRAAERIRRTRYYLRLRLRDEERRALVQELVADVAAWSQEVREPLRAAAIRELIRRHPDHHRELLRAAEAAEGVEVIPPPALEEPRARIPHNATVIGDRLRGFGWRVELEFRDPDEEHPRPRVRLCAADDVGTRLRLTFQHGTGKSSGWTTRWPEARAGTEDDYVTLPSVAALIELASMGPEDYLDELEVYQRLAVSRRTTGWVDDRRERPTPEDEGHPGAVE